MLGALQARTTRGVDGSTPLPRDEQYWALMGPGAPLYPSPLNTPNPATGQADPRRWQYPVSYNITQDAGRLVDWSTLRHAAREVDLISECIRVRRTEQSELEWDITLTRRTIEANGIESTQDKNELLKKYAPQISKLIDFWMMPDTTNGFSWPEWVEQVIHESLVTDAVSIFPECTYGGKLLSLGLVDGASIKPLLDERGNRPRPPAAAYQQWLYGFPRGEYTDNGSADANWSGAAGSLIYKPRFLRVESPYGYSPVEQSLVSAELWLRRQQWMMAEYTAGTTPRMILKATGIQYTPEQLRAYEDVLNDYYGGSTGNRHRIRLFPDGFDPSLTEDAAERYKPDYDEFLVKLLCAHMGVQPQEIGFTPRNGLGGAGHGESQESITYRKALRPTARWLVGIMNQISYAYLDMPRDLTFQFLGLDEEGETDADALEEKRFMTARSTLNETRDAAGKPRYDFDEADKPMIVTARGVVFLEGSSKLVEPGELVTPVEAPPLQGPPEGADSGVDSSVPVVAAREAKESGQAPDKPADKPVDVQDAKKTEMAAYRRWARKDHPRPFAFEHVTKADAELAEVDLDRVVFKAGGGAGKAPARHWPGWEQDQQVATYHARRLSEALTGALDTRALAQRWLSVRKSVEAIDATAWLHHQGITLDAAMADVLEDLYTEGFFVGQRSAGAVLAGGSVDWSDWTPGNPAAARALIGEDMNLARLLSHAGVTISSIADHRLTDLAQALADGLANGDSVDTLARALRGVLDNPAWAELVATTETTRAMSYATQQTYLANGIAGNFWLTSQDQRTCLACDQNEAYGDVPVGQDFPSGQSMPPAHGNCRCALAPVTE
jgi:SPP1 gp7 family putative phage head morphogenesis protein